MSDPLIPDDLVGVIERLIKDGPDTMNTSEEVCCFWCRAEGYPSGMGAVRLEDHEPDCPYLSAQQMVNRYRRER